MTRYKNFDAAREAEDLEPVLFDMRGDKYEGVPQCPGGVLLDMAAVAGKGGSEAVEAAFKFMDAVLVEESAERFRAALRRKDNPISVPDITDLTQWLVECYTGRPTEPPSTLQVSPSTAGPLSTDGAWTEG